MTTKTLLQNGFTAVELLITLFIASIFLFSGYQLYTQVTSDGRDADKMARVSNIVYEKVQKKAAEATSAYPYGCKVSPLPSPYSGVAAEQVTGVGEVTFTTVVKCPHGPEVAAKLFLVDVEAVYKSNNAERRVRHAIYAN